MKLQVKTHGYRMTKQDKDKLDETAEHLDRT